MNTYKGKAAYKGVAVGPILVLEGEEQQVKRVHVEDSEAELERFHKAVKSTDEQLDNLYKKALTQVGTAEADIFQIHRMMLTDEDFTDSIVNTIESQYVNAEYAVAQATDAFAEMFSNMDDEYMKARSTDIRDISNRLIKELYGHNQTSLVFSEPSIILSDDLTPSQTVSLDKSKILGFVTVKGSVNSHTAILARMMNIPALVQTDIKDLESMNGKYAVVDSVRGFLICNPSEDEIEKANQTIEKSRAKAKLEQQYLEKEDVTADGKHIKLYANIAKVSDVNSVLENNCKGVGLFRSEFLYLGRNDYPSEQEQYTAYKQVATIMGDKPVIIRTLDIGADKQVDYFNLEKEENPAMGYRAIRICLDRRELFKTQLRAILRASISGNLMIMYPMIISVEEIIEIKKIMNEVMQDLDKMGITYKVPKQGVMIETPAAVMISDLLAEEVDFFSIGTNDLTQYTLAIDRQNAKLDDFYNPHHEAILRMIELVCKNAEKHNIWVGICGELAADTELTERFIRMGVSELSVSPTFILSVRKQICESRFKSD